MNEAELTVRIIAASGPPAVDDLTTFLRKRVAEDRTALESAPPATTSPDQPRLAFVNVNGGTTAFLPIARFIAHLDAIDTTLDKHDAALSNVLRGREMNWEHSNTQAAMVAYMDVIKLHAVEYAAHPDYRENWRP
ncbi:DUF6221 family protein [Streptomyces sp. NPDC005548]|uniref:DUF6221 family protein n=1 Tax=Streptomyces sp. NPDC005548 TaxID=3364724 RepID=UPI00367592A0